jgi:hypothetical protein
VKKKLFAEKKNFFLKKSTENGDRLGRRKDPLPMNPREKLNFF